MISQSIQWIFAIGGITITYIVARYYSKRYIHKKELKEYDERKNIRSY